MQGFASFADPWWIPVLYIVIVGHLSNLCVTLFLHRSATHEGVKFAKPVEHFMRLWLWLTTGMNTREWVAVHRKHHAHADREGDPHSPHTEGLAEILFGGVFFYREEAKNEETLDKYGRGCPDDWMERRVYSAKPFYGLLIMLAVDIALFRQWQQLVPRRPRWSWPVRATARCCGEPARFRLRQSDAGLAGESRIAKRL
jgi:stearoyl-CoA desaturase (delta-9 desaturase)